LVSGRKGATTRPRSFCAELARLQRWRRSGGSPEDAIGRAIVENLQTKLVEFFQQLLAENGKQTQ